MPEVSGFADARIKFSGPIDAPSFQGSLGIPGLQWGDWGPVDVGSTFRYEYGALLAHLEVGDEDGQLFESEGSVLIDLVHLVQNPSETIEALETSPWRLALRVPPRRLSAFPEAMGKELLPDADRLRVAGSLSIAGGAFRTRGDLHASFDWVLDTTEGLCGSEANPRATVRARLIDGVTNGRRRRR
jgi:hypothetical protein